MKMEQSNTEKQTYKIEIENTEVEVVRILTEAVLPTHGNHVGLKVDPTTIRTLLETKYSKGETIRTDSWSASAKCEKYDECGKLYMYWEGAVQDTD